MKWFLVLLILLGGCKAPLSVTPHADSKLSAVIDGPDSGNIGDLIILDASKSQADGLTWIHLDTDTPEYLSIDNGEKLVFSSPRASTFHFALVATKVSSKGEALVLVQPRNIVIGAPPSPPAPGPTPPAPVPKDEIAESVKSALSGHVDDAKVFYGVHSALADSLTQGKFKTVGEVMDARNMLLRNNKWVMGRFPKLSDAMNTAFASYAQDCLLTDVSRKDLINKFTSIANGSKAVP